MIHEVLPDRLTMYVKCQSYVTGKNYGFSILVFQDNTSKNQDFFMTFSAPMSNFRTFQFLKNEKSNFRTFQDFSAPVGTLVTLWRTAASCKSSQLTQTCLLHFRNTRSDNTLSPILALCGLMKRPLWLNTRSTGVEVAGAQKIFSNRLCRTVNCASCCTAFHGSAKRPVHCWRTKPK